MLGVLGLVPLEGLPPEPAGRWAAVGKQSRKPEMIATVMRMELVMSAPLFPVPETLARLRLCYADSDELREKVARILRDKAAL